jgi:DNA-binding NarL/FixJ family response regulator
MSCTFSELAPGCARRDGARETSLLYGTLFVMNSPAIRILSIEDHPVFAEGLRLILESQEDMALVGHATTVAAATGKFADTRPDVVLLDLRLPDTQGIEGVLAVRKQFPQARVIMLTTVDQDGEIQHTLEAGAAAYVLKSAPKNEILAAIRTVHAGRKHIPAAVAARLAERFGEDELTPRELEVLGYIRDGSRNKQIADKLGISETTVNFHIKNIVEKLQAKDRTHALVIALRRGLLPM